MEFQRSHLNIIKTRATEFAPRFGINADAPVLIHVGRLSPEKNHRFLLDIFRCIKQINTEATLLIVGRGPLEPDLKQYAKLLEVDESTLFLQYEMMFKICFALLTFSFFHLRAKVSPSPLLSPKPQAFRVWCQANCPKKAA